MIEIVRTIAVFAVGLAVGLAIGFHAGGAAVRRRVDRDLAARLAIWREIRRDDEVR